MEVCQPLLTEIEYFDPVKYFNLFYSWQNIIFFDSSMYHADLGRYSYIGIDPYKIITCKDRVIKIDNKISSLDDFWQILRAEIKVAAFSSISGVGPFQGGIAGFFSYDLSRSIELLPTLSHDEFAHDDFALGCYDLILSFDNLRRRAFIISTGSPEKSDIGKLKRAKSRLDWLNNYLKKDIMQTNSSAKNMIVSTLTSNFSKNTYKKTVEKVKEYIYAGDVFEVNLAQRFKCRFSNKNSVDLYLKLRDSNKAPFSAYVNIGETTILSSSPERFIKLENNKIEARPIKGTIKRSMLDFDDRKLAKTLQQSPKDRAENIMIVDLMRNDLSRVAIPSSVSVDILCGLETYTNVHHLVSVITAELKHNHDSISLLQACFPGGSITGAPKIRAMEIIDELEPQRRGPYCGSLGYIGGNGNLDLSILIRSIVIKGDNLTFHSGGAITLDSDPEQEWNETLLKAEALKTILKA